MAYKGYQQYTNSSEYCGARRMNLFLHSVLDGTRDLPSLNTMKWQDDYDHEHSLTTSQRLDFKRSKIGVSVTVEESDERSKFELFQRLNTGGSPLSPQEVRSCILVMLNRQMFYWLKYLAADNNFRECIALQIVQLKSNMT